MIDVFMCLFLVFSCTPLPAFPAHSARRVQAPAPGDAVLSPLVPSPAPVPDVPPPPALHVEARGRERREEREKRRAQTEASWTPFGGRVWGKGLVTTNGRLCPLMVSEVTFGAHGW